MSKPIRTMMTIMPCTVGNKTNLKKAKEIMMEHSHHHLPVLDGGKLVGILSTKDLSRTAARESELKVEDIMTTDPVTVQPNDDAFEVALLMRKEKISSVIVAATLNSPWGIFTTTDALDYLSNKQIEKENELSNRADPSENNSFE